MKIHKPMLNVMNDIMNAIEAKMSKPMSEDDLFGNLSAEKLKTLPFEINLQAKNEFENMMFKYSMMFHNSSKQPIQAHQCNVFSNQMSLVPATSSTPTPSFTNPTSSCTNNTAINLPASSEFPNNRINFP